MRLALFTNIPAHYQISLAQAFVHRLDTEFALVCWEPRTEDRRQLGWPDDYEAEWLIKAWTSVQARSLAMDLLRSADVVVWGYAPSEEINERVHKGKLTFRYTERPFKQGWRILDPRVLRGYKKISDGKAHHLLAVGPYCVDDFRLLRSFDGRMWRWGYFPAVPESTAARYAQAECIILWAGRMLPWKRVDLLLRAVAWARAQGGRSFRVELIGCGPEEGRLRSLAARLHLADICHFRPPASPREVGAVMEQSDIYVLPSDRSEGWGAVVNEAMARGCCVIGSRAAGAVPWLIRNGENGYVFESSSEAELGQILRRCVDHVEERIKVGRSARQTMMELWSPGVAADRLLELCKAFERGKPSPFADEGPCSPGYRRVPAERKPR